MPKYANFPYYSVQHQDQSPVRQAMNKEYKPVKEALASKDLLKIRNAAARYVAFLSLQSYIERMPGVSLSNWENLEDSILAITPGNYDLLRDIKKKSREICGTVYEEYANLEAEHIAHCNLPE